MAKKSRDTLVNPSLSLPPLVLFGDIVATPLSQSVL